MEVNNNDPRSEIIGARTTKGEEMKQHKLFGKITEDYPLQDWEFAIIDEELYPLIKKILGINYEINEDLKLFDWYCDIRNNLCQQIHDKKESL